MIAAILITALVMGYPLSNRTRERDEARRELRRARGERDGEFARAEDLAYDLAAAEVELALHEIGREIRAELRTLDTRPLAPVVPIRPGVVS